MKILFIVEHQLISVESFAIHEIVSLWASQIFKYESVIIIIIVYIYDIPIRIGDSF